MMHLFAIGLYIQTHALSIVLAVIASFVVGFLWHGPLFGKQWMKFNKITPPKKKDMKFSMMLPGIGASLLMAFAQAAVLGSAFMMMSASSVWEALLIATILWLPFTALVILNEHTWAGKSFAHTSYDAAYNLASTFVMAAILYAML